MENYGHRENGRQRLEQYKAVHTQWTMPQRHAKEHQNVDFFALMNERDSALRERDEALAEKKAALAERDTAIAQRNAAIIERDNARAALELAREGGTISSNCWHGCPQRSFPRSAKSSRHRDAKPTPIQPAEMHIISDAYPISMVPGNIIREHKAKRRKQSLDQASPSQKLLKAAHVGKRSVGDSHTVKNTAGLFTRGENLNKVTIMKKELKNHGMGLNQVTFDESCMPVPGCSCTGRFRSCYKWGNGGWQSSCCTTSMSMYPLPVMPNKRHSRMAGRKMSGSVFSRLLSQLADAGRDLSLPVDLKDHWARHGTNKYVTIK